MTVSGDILASNVTGILQDNGDFIFHVDTDHSHRQMVKTMNNGTFIEAGWLKLPFDANWKDTNTWTGTLWYRINNFRGIKGNTIFCDQMQGRNCNFFINVLFY